MGERMVLAGMSAFMATLAFMVLSIVPTLEPLMTLLLEPGFALPRQHWGGVHDPLQILFGFALNVVFYAVLFYCLFHWKDRQRSKAELR
jgi:hypothetical protein